MRVFNKQIKNPKNMILVDMYIKKNIYLLKISVAFIVCDVIFIIDSNLVIRGMPISGYFKSIKIIYIF